MKKLLDKTTKLIFQQQGGMFSSALILSFMIVISRIFGFLRYRILLAYFTTGQLDIFFASFRIPDLVFEILITGAFTASFIPIYIRYQKNREELSNNISTIFNLLSIFLGSLIVLTYFLIPFFMPLITPGFTGEKMKEIIYYSQLLVIVQLPFLVLGNYLTGIAQANKSFLISSIAPVIYNVLIIVSALLFSDKLGLQAAVLGVNVGAVCFFLIQIPNVMSFDFIYRPVIHITRGVRDFFRIVVPRIMTVLLAQIDATVDLTLTSLLGTGAYTVFYLAQRLQLLPVSIIGISFGQASLPYLSELFEEQKIDELKKIIADSILNVFFFTIPIMGFFIFARTPVVRLFFGGDKFDWESTVQTAITTSYFALSLPFHSIYYFLTRCFYAFHDSKTPFYISLFSIAVNTVFSVLFIFFLHLPVWSLAISFSLSMIVSVFALIYYLYKKVQGLPLLFISVESLKMLFSAGIASIFSYLFIKLLDGLVLDTSRTINVFFLLVIGGFVYLLIYIFLSWVVDVKEFYLIGKLFWKFKNYQKRLVEIYSSYE